MHTREPLDEPGSMPMNQPPRTSIWVWVQLLIGWLPVAALFVILVLAEHRDATLFKASLIATRMVVTAALLSVLVQQLVRRLPWPHPFQLRFLAIHLLSAALYACAWFALNTLLEALLGGAVVRTANHTPGNLHLVLMTRYPMAHYVILGVWLYVMVAGVSYAAREAERAARAEATAARSRLAALRSQLNPHFLFNILHSVVQLIPRAPDHAAAVAQRLADLLRHSLEEDRDLVPLQSEWRFVARYLELESMRFGERLTWNAALAPATLDIPVPTFAVQTLVENAVRHGAAPRVEPTRISVEAGIQGDDIVITVTDDGAGLTSAPATAGQGSGLKRVRDRLAALYGSRAQLQVEPARDGGTRATLILPCDPDRI